MIIVILLLLLLMMMLVHAEAMAAARSVVRSGIILLHDFVVNESHGLSLHDCEECITHLLERKMCYQ